MLIEKYLSGSYSYLITFKEDKTSYLSLASTLLNSKKGIGGDYLIVVNKETKEILKEVPFASIYVCKDFLEKDLIFEKLEVE